MWSSAPLVPLALGAITLLYFLGWWRLRRRGPYQDLANVPRALSFLAGVEVLNLALTSPLDHIAHHPLLSSLHGPAHT